jgi:hypothetical protein
MLGATLRGTARFRTPLQHPQSGNKKNWRNFGSSLRYWQNEKVCRDEGERNKFIAEVVARLAKKSAGMHHSKIETVLVACAMEHVEDDDDALMVFGMRAQQTQCVARARFSAPPASEPTFQETYLRADHGIWKKQ